MIPRLPRPPRAARAALASAAVFLALAAGAAAQRAPLVSPELHRNGSVTFRLARPGAHEVLLALAGQPAPLKMTESGGVWSLTTAPLPSGAYWYSYLIDGASGLDPLNADVMPNYQYLNSVVRVPGAAPEPWERRDVPHGELHRHFYASKIARGLPGGQSDYYVYTPPD